LGLPKSGSRLTADQPREFKDRRFLGIDKSLLSSELQI
jgi:hypothetical protein